MRTSVRSFVLQTYELSFESEEKSMRNDIGLKLEGGLAIITLRRGGTGERGNAFTPSMFEELGRIINRELRLDKL